MKCPYCRTYVENYEPLERYCFNSVNFLLSNLQQENSKLCVTYRGTALGENLNEANKAAKAAAAARHGPKMPSVSRYIWCCQLPSDCLTVVVSTDPNSHSASRRLPVCYSGALEVSCLWQGKHRVQRDMHQL